MGRYEVALDSELELRDYSEFPPGRKLRELPKQLDPLVIEFQGRRLVWHPSDGEHLPVVTIMVDDDLNYEPERLLVERFLSALSYEYRASIRVYTSGGTGYKKELDTPLLKQPRLKPTIHPAPASISRSSDDESLALALAHMREGVSSASPAHRFLSYWKAAEVAITEGFTTWIGDAAKASAKPEDARTSAEHFEYLNDTRNAAAHAVRDDLDALQHDPDHPQPIERFHIDGSMLFRLARKAIDTRWPHPTRTS